MVYFDNAATTELSQYVKEQMYSAMDIFGNPSSLHMLGIDAENIIICAKKSIANTLKCRSDEIFFTSGGTESDNTAIFGAVQAMKRRGNKIVTTAFEHSAVLSPLKELENEGFEVVYLKPDENGTISEQCFYDAIDEKTILVTVMHINNETGAILPIDKIKGIIKSKNSPALFHCDATQSFCKYDIFPSKWGIDLLTASAHKIHGPKGIGFLYTANGVKIKPLLYGGLQQKGFRPGTESTILIAGFDAAIKDFGDKNKNRANVQNVKQYIIEKLSNVDGITINSPKNSSDYILSISVCGIKSETLLHFLENDEIYVSSGSACSKGKLSHVVEALGMDRKRADSVLRISFSKYSTTDEADKLVECIKNAQSRLIRVN